MNNALEEDERGDEDWSLHQGDSESMACEK